jgi:hypothetical protein
MERILCSALFYNDGKPHVNQPTNISSGFVVTGFRHANCYATVSAILGQDKTIEMKQQVGREGQGFLTSNNRFVDRKEGMIIAMTAGQLLYPKLHEGNENAELTSEDLY